MISLINPFNNRNLKNNGNFFIDSEGNKFNVEDGVLRIVKEINYTGSFGFQWNKFQKTQLDREAQNFKFSKERFFAETDWDKEDLSGKNILEVGSGAGRFSTVLLQYTNANLYSIDYSDAVSANYKNNGHYGDRFRLCQASVYEMPFPANSFDKVFCFGVLQHTPDFKRSVKSLADKVKPGCELVVDFYCIKGWWTKIHSKYLLRPITKKMKHERLLRLIEKNVGWLMQLYFFFDKIKVGRIINRFLPICDIKGTLPPNLNKQELKEWVILDTFDMFSPQYDQPQKLSTVKKWFEEFGMEIQFAGEIIYANRFKAIVVKGIKK